MRGGRKRGNKSTQTHTTHTHAHTQACVIDSGRAMRVMAACARARVLVFEKAHALMKHIHITCKGKYTEIARQTLPKELAGLH